MTLKAKAAEKLFGAEIDRLIQDRLPDAMDKAVEEKTAHLKAAGYSDSLGAPNMGGEVDKDGTVWTRLTQTPKRELVPLSQDRMIEIAYWLWETNPLAGWLIDITTAFIVADGLPYSATHPDVKKVLDAFWDDPANRLSLYFPKHVDEIHMFGELCLPAFTAEQTGRVRLGYTDPAQIKEVFTDPENVRLVIGVQTKGWVGSIAGVSVNTKEKLYRTILPEEAEYVMSDAAKQIREQLTDGECFFWSINNVTNSPRGRSSLLPVSDWLDAYEQYLFDYAEKWPLLNAFVWDLLVKGADEKEIKAQVQLFTKKSGTVYGHNENATLTAVAPDLKALDAETGARLFRNHILGRFGYPEHWYGGGGDVNRATAEEMSAPALKMMRRKQMTVKYICEDMLSYQIRQARKARYLVVSEEEAGQWSVDTPQMETKDVSKLGSMVQAVATALMTAETQEWIDKGTARKLFAAITSFIGVDIDLDEVQNAIKEEKDKTGKRTPFEDYLEQDGGEKLKELVDVLQKIASNGVGFPPAKP